MFCSRCGAENLLHPRLREHWRSDWVGRQNSHWLFGSEGCVEIRPIRAMTLWSETTSSSGF